MLVFSSKKKYTRPRHAIIVTRTSRDEPTSVNPDEIAEAIDCVECLHDGPVEYTIVPVKASAENAVDEVKAAVARCMDQRVCDFIVVEDLTRLSRSTKKLSKLIATWAKMGATVVSCEDLVDAMDAA